MTWSTLGWILIGLTAALLIIFTTMRKAQGSYEVREVPAIQRLLSARSAALEEGKALHLGLGQRIFSGLYPGAELYSLSILPNFLNREIRNSDAVSVSSGDSVLAVLAHQIIQNQYGDGYSFLLDQRPVLSNLPGPTPLSSTAGLLNLFSFDKYASVALVGNYGLESALFLEAVRERGGAFFSAAGNLTAQAALYPSTIDLLIGENVYLLSGSLRGKDAFPARFFTEDILRIVVMMILVTAVILKLLGVL